MEAVDTQLSTQIATHFEPLAAIVDGMAHTLGTQGPLIDALMHALGTQGLQIDAVMHTLRFLQSRVVESENGRMGTLAARDELSVAHSESTSLEEEPEFDTFETYDEFVNKGCAGEELPEVCFSVPADRPLEFDLDDINAFFDKRVPCWINR